LGILRSANAAYTNATAKGFHNAQCHQFEAFSKALWDLWD